MVEFAEWGFSTSASLFSLLRDFFIEKFGVDATDAVIPAWQIDAVREGAQETEGPHPAFTEFSIAAPAVPEPSTTEDSAVDE